MVKLIVSTDRYGEHHYEFDTEAEYKEETKPRWPFELVQKES